MNNPFLIDEATQGTLVRPMSFRPGMGTQSHQRSTQTDNGGPKIGSTAPPSRPQQTRQVTNIIQRAHKTVLRQAKLNQRAARLQKKTAPPPASSPASKASQQTEAYVPKFQETFNNVLRAAGPQTPAKELLDILMDSVRNRSLTAVVQVLANPNFPFAEPRAQAAIKAGLDAFPAGQRAQAIKTILGNPGFELVNLEKPEFSLGSLVRPSSFTEPRAWFGHPIRSWTFEKRYNPQINQPQIIQVDLYPFNTVHVFTREGSHWTHFITSIEAFEGRLSQDFHSQFPERIAFELLPKLAD